MDNSVRDLKRGMAALERASRQLEKMGRGRAGIVIEAEEMAKNGYRPCGIIEVEMYEKKGLGKYTFRDYKCPIDGLDKWTSESEIPDTVAVELLSYKELEKRVGKKTAKEFREMCLEIWPITRDVARNLIATVGIKQNL